MSIKTSLYYIGVVSHLTYFTILSQSFLDLRKTLYGLGDKVIPSIGSGLGKSRFDGGRISKEWMNDAKNRNTLDLAKFSPMHRRFPVKVNL